MGMLGYSIGKSSGSVRSKAIASSLKVQRQTAINLKVSVKEILGLFTPRSQSEIVLGCFPSAAATCICVNPARCRNSTGDKYSLSGTIEAQQYSLRHIGEGEYSQKRQSDGLTFPGSKPSVLSKYQFLKVLFSLKRLFLKTYFLRFTVLLNT